MFNNAFLGTNEPKIRFTGKKRFKEAPSVKNVNGQVLKITGQDLDICRTQMNDFNRFQDSQIFFNFQYLSWLFLYMGKIGWTNKTASCVKNDFRIS